MLVYPSGLLFIVRHVNMNFICEHKSTVRITDFILGAVCVRTITLKASNSKSHSKGKYCYYFQFRDEEILKTTITSKKQTNKQTSAFPKPNAKRWQSQHVK